MPGTTTTGYKLLPSSTPLINWTALWHIVLVSVAAGAGLAIAFGLILLGMEFFQESRSGAQKALGAVLGVLAAAFCVGVIVLGIHVMVNPAKSKPQKVVKSALATRAQRPAA